MANEIYAAESSDEGGTWSGVIDGLRKNRKIFVRKLEDSEKNANHLLIQKVAIPIDFIGKTIENYFSIEDNNLFSTVNELTADYKKKSMKNIRINLDYNIEGTFRKLNFLH